MKPTSAVSLSQLAELTRQINDNTAEYESEKRFRTLPLNDIYSIEQPRKVFEGIKELAENMKQIGQLQPIVVNPDGTGKYIIEQGERRYRAARLAGIKSLDAVINPKSPTQAERIIRQLAENVQRDNMKLFELVRSVHAILEMGMTGVDLSKRLGMHQSEISALNSVAELPPILENLMIEREIEDVKALRRLNAIYKKKPQAVETQITNWKAKFKADQEDALANNDDKAAKFVVTRAQVAAFDRGLKLLEAVSVPPVPVEEETRQSGDEVDPGQLPGQGRPAGSGDPDSVPATGPEYPVLNGSESATGKYQKVDPGQDSEATVASTAPLCSVIVFVAAPNAQGEGRLVLDHVPPVGTVDVMMTDTKKTVSVRPDQLRLIGIGEPE